MNTYLAKGSNITFSFSLFTKENVYLMSSTPALSSSRDHVITRKNSNRYRKNIIHIPEGISYIATEAFQHQSCIRSVSFPDSLRKIGARAFQGCTFMESALLPQSMVQLGPGAFSDCPKLEKQFIPSGISELPREIFRDDQKLQSVTFGENSRLHIIRDNAFSSCISLDSLDLPDNITEICDRAFYRCKNLQNIHLPHNLHRIGIQAFYFCGIKNLVLPDSLEILEESAFFKCNSLISVVIPTSVKCIRKWVFHGCNRLQYLEIRHDPDFIGEWIINRAATIRCYQGSKVDKYCQDSGFHTEYL